MTATIYVSRFQWFQVWSLTWSHEVEELIWVKSNKFACHQTVNEIISIMGQNSLRTL